jgi:hypothetical protein
MRAFKMKKISIIPFALMLMLAIFLAGCSTTQNSDGSTSNDDTSNSKSLFSNEPTYIGNLRTQDGGDSFEVIFSLYDSKEEFTTADGTASIRIVNDNNEEVYKGSQKVLKSGFGKFTQTLTGAEFQAYSFEIPYSKIKKSTSSSGTLYLAFETNGGTKFEELEDDTVYGLPEFSDEELEEKSSSKYDETSKTVDLSLSSTEGLKVSLEKYGFFEKHSYSSIEKLLRVDLIIKNEGSDEIYFSNYGSVILDEDGNQYESAYGGTISSEDLKAGVSKSGYMLFEDVPEDVKISKIIIGEDYVFDLVNSKAYTPEQMAEENYLNSIVKVEETKKMDRYLSVTFDSIGLMTLNNKKYIRVDITAKNIGNEKISYYSPNPVILGQSSNQYEDSYVYNFDGEFDSGDIYPDVVKKGALFFEVEKNDLLDLKELIIETGLSSYSKESRNIGDGQALFYNQEYVFKFDLTDIDLK